MSLLWSSKRLTVVSPSEPVLVVALLGFDAGESLALEAMFETCEALSAKWRTGPAGRADLWIVNGRAVSPQEGEELEIDGLRFRPGEVSRPVAFAQPLPPSVDARFHFDPASESSLSAMLAAMGAWLSPRVVQQALVGHLLANAARFTRSTVIHVQDGDRLLAVMNFAGDTGVATDATPAAIRRADWLLRPSSAGFVPSIFHGAPTDEVLWRFATRTRHLDVLPGRYLRLPIYLRRAPALRPEEVTPRQATLVDEIAKGGHTFRSLRARLDCGDDELKQELGALYLVHAITCDPMRSASAAQRERWYSPRPGMDPSTTTGASSTFGSPPPPREGAGAIRSDAAS